MAISIKTIILFICYGAVWQIGTNISGEPAASFLSYVWKKLVQMWGCIGMCQTT